MKLRINTAEFKDMVAKATKGASNNHNVYMTELMAIELKDNKLTLTTTDSSNYLYVVKDKVIGDDFYAVVPVEKFSKLIAKQTCEDITLETSISDKGELDKLIVHGNGRYVIELPYDEDGELVEFPDPMSEDDGTGWNKADVQLSTIHLILTTAKASILRSDDASIPYIGYYIGDRVVATDSYKICGIDVKLLDEPRLIPQGLMDLLDVLSEENVEVRYNEDTIIFVTGNEIVYGHPMDNIGEFQIDAISSLLDEPFPSSCKIDKTTLIQMLDRLSLFVSVNDRGGVYLTFTKDGLNVSSKQGSGDEVIPYIESSNFTDYTCCVDINMFTSQVKANQAVAIEIMYGKNSLKLLDGGNTKQIVALSDDDRFEEDEG